MTLEIERLPDEQESERTRIAPSVWEQMANKRADFIGGVLQDTDGPAQPTTITNVKFEDNCFSVDGVDYGCGVNCNYASLSADAEWIHIYGVVGMGFRFKGPMKGKSVTTRHTPGKWEVGIDGVGHVRFIASKEDPYRIAEIDTYDEADLDARMEANARLIAASPELLEEVKRLRKIVRDVVDLVDGGVALEFNLGETDALIAKAEGE